MTTTPQPSTSDTALQQADLLFRAGELAEAEDLYRAVLHKQPDYIPALIDFARVLEAQGKSEEAVAMFRRVVALKPDMPLAHKNLGVILCQNGRLEEGFASFRRHAELTYGTSQNSARESEPIGLHKALHDSEQRAYLNENVQHDKNLFHIEGGDRVAGQAVNPDASLGKIAEQWRNNAPQIVVIDNFLTDEALKKLREFCLGSTIWQRVYSDGYLGAMPEHGIGSPLLAQITEELRSTYLAVLGQHPLLHFWGFKYDSRLSGVALHADFAAVNVNFWITPDDANLDPESGGLIIWDKPAPLDWDFSKYNDDVASARNFLARAGAQATKIPYRSNQVVIFDSDLFHETDRIAFKEGYLNRRINITLLYGRRENAGAW